MSDIDASSCGGDDACNKRRRIMQLSPEQRHAFDNNDGDDDEIGFQHLGEEGYHRRWEYVAESDDLAPVLEEMRRNHLSLRVQMDGFRAVNYFALRNMHCIEAERAAFIDFQVIVETVEKQRHDGQQRLQANEASWRRATVRDVSHHHNQDSIVHLKNAIETIVSAMKQFPSNSKLQSHGCDLIRKIAVTQELRLSILSRGGAEAVLGAMTRLTTNENLQLRACEAINNLSLMEPDCSSLNSAGAVEATVGAMKMFALNRDIQMQGCSALRWLAEDDETEARVVDAGGIGAILAAMERFPSNENLQVRACGAIRNLTSSGDSVSAIKSANGVRAILNVMRAFTNNEEIQGDCCAALGNLSHTAAASMKKAALCHSERTKAVLLAMNTHKFSEELQRNACGALRSILSRRKDRDILGLDWVKPIVGAMKRFPHNYLLQGYAIQTFASTSVEGKTQSEIVNSGALKYVLLATSNWATSNHLQLAGVELIFNLVANSDALQHVAGSDGMGVTLRAMENFATNMPIQRLGCDVLARFAKDTDLLASIAAAGTGAAVGGAMRQFPDQYQIQAAACNLFARFLDKDDCGRMIRDAGGIATIINAVDQFQGQAGLLVDAMDALSTFAFDDSDAKRAIFSCGEGSFVTMAMRRFDDNVEIQRASCFLLGCLAENMEAHAIQIGEQGGVDLVLRALRRFSSDEKLARSGCFALESLGGALQNRREIEAAGQVARKRESLRDDGRTDLGK